MSAPRRKAPLENLPPIGLRREEAAAHIRIGETKFDEMVRDGRMPKPRRIDSATVWDRLDVERKFRELPYDEQPEEEIIL
jgi:predicted DNA-binding transcriptional regulator AlpA